MRMDRADALNLARTELHAIENAGYGVAAELVDTIILKDVVSQGGITYKVEITYLWKDPDDEQILVICKITSKDWFEHQNLQESITLECEEI